MSITFVTSSLRLSGGVLVLRELANGLVELGYRVSFVTSAGGAAPQIRHRLSAGVKIWSAPTSLEQASSLPGKLQLAWHLAHLVPRCDVVVATHTPTVLPTLWARHILRRASRTVWFHQDYAEMFESRPLELWLLRHAPPWFDRVVTVSHASQEEIWRASGVTAEVVPQGSSIASTPDRRAPAPMPATEVVLFLGDRRPRKGWDDFLAAAEQVYERHPRLRLAIATKDPGRLDTPVPYDLHLQPSWDKLPELYGSCQVFVSASWWESFGRPPLEAMAHGVPVVTTDSRGVREYAQDGVNCLMVPIRNPAALAAAIDRVLTDRDLAQRLADAGLRTAQEFTWQRAVSRFVEAVGAET